MTNDHACTIEVFVLAYLWIHHDIARMMMERRLMARTLWFDNFCLQLAHLCVIRVSGAQFPLRIPCHTSIARRLLLTFIHFKLVTVCLVTILGSWLLSTCITLVAQSLVRLLHNHAFLVILLQLLRRKRTDLVLQGILLHMTLFKRLLCLRY